MTDLELHYICKYLNEDRLFHRNKWNLDAGKLKTAMEFAKKEAARVSKKRDQANLSWTSVSV